MYVAITVAAILAASGAALAAPLNTQPSSPASTTAVTASPHDERMVIPREASCKIAMTSCRQNRECCSGDCWGSTGFCTQTYGPEKRHALSYSNPYGNNNYQMTPEQYAAAYEQAHRELIPEEYAAQYYQTHGGSSPAGPKVPFLGGPVIPPGPTLGGSKPPFLAGPNGVPVSADIIPGGTPGGKPGKPTSPFKMGPNGIPIIDTDAMAYAAAHQELDDKHPELIPKFDFDAMAYAAAHQKDPNFIPNIDPEALAHQAAHQ